MKKKIILLSLCTIMVTQAVSDVKIDSTGRAIEISKNKKHIVDEGKELGRVSVLLKAIHIASDLNNGFAPNNGTGFLAKLKYETPEILTEGLRLGLGTYLTGTAGLMQWDKNNPQDGFVRAAYGLATDARGAEKGVIGELYLSYKNKYLGARLGRQTLKTPLTQIQISLVPNFYEAYMFDTDVVKGFKLTAGQITRMSFGSRVLPDNGIIGEQTGTAGSAIAANRFVAFNAPGADMHQGHFYNISTAAGFNETTRGRSVIGATYKGVKNLKVDGWIYHSDKIANDFYTEVGYTLPVSNEINVKLNGQYLAQRDTGVALAGKRDFNMMGAKAALGTKKWGTFVAMNKSGNNDDDSTVAQYFNAWGADPAYTSSIFSRNAYRADVTAYKVGGHYVIMKGLRLMVNYANYGQSKSRLGSTFSGDVANPARGAQTDAYELDTVLVYKPAKEWTFKAFHALRTSEFDGLDFRIPNDPARTLVSERRMSHYRLMASYSF